jgi:hypothetical protein
LTQAAVYAEIRQLGMNAAQGKPSGLVGVEAGHVIKLLTCLLLATPLLLEAQYTYSNNNNGTVTITGYTGPGGSVTIPATLGGLPVSVVGTFAFSNCTTLTAVTFPNSVGSIGVAAFYTCPNLTNATLGNGVTNLGNGAFSSCSSLANVILGRSLASIGSVAFLSCSSLTSLTIPAGVTNIGDNAFIYCSSLTTVYFQGNAPHVGSAIFSGDNSATAYVMPGTTNWGTTFAGLPVVLWNPHVQAGDPTFGVRTNRFGFTIVGSTGLVVVVQACTNLINPVWSLVSTNTLTAGSSYFSDPAPPNFPRRFYRFRSP